MKKGLWMLIAPAIIAVLIMGLFGACRNPLRDGWLTGSADVRLSVIIPDYFNRAFPTPAGSSPAHQPRIIDPATFSIDITVFADDMETVTQSFTLDEAGTYTAGYWTMDCYVRNIPAGTDRLFTIETRDTSGELLTTGTTTVTLVSGEDNGFAVSLLPADAPESTLEITASGSVAYGRMSYHTVTFENTGAYRINLLSSMDVDLYLFNDDGTLFSDDYWERATPTDEEAALGITETGTSLFIGVFGNEEGATATYTITVSSADPPATVPVFKTGQTTDAYLAGDDGHLEKGRAWPSPRFIDNADGTLTDNMTGLMWQAAADTNDRTWEQALAYANNSTIGTYPDWRLPNVFELESLYNYNLAWASPNNQSDWLNSTGFSNITNTRYWTSTTVAGTVTDAFIINFGYPRILWETKTVSFSRRALIVRGSSSVIPKTGQTCKR